LLDYWGLKAVTHTKECHCFQSEREEVEEPQQDQTTWFDLQQSLERLWSSDGAEAHLDRLSFDSIFILEITLADNSIKRSR
jgi:hypothetical protein